MFRNSNGLEKNMERIYTGLRKENGTILEDDMIRSKIVNRKTINTFIDILQKFLY